MTYLVFLLFRVRLLHHTSGPSTSPLSPLVSKPHQSHAICNFNCGGDIVRWYTFVQRVEEGVRYTALWASCAHVTGGAVRAHPYWLQLVCQEV